MKNLDLKLCHSRWRAVRAVGLWLHYRRCFWTPSMSCSEAWRAALGSDATEWWESVPPTAQAMMARAFRKTT